MTARKKNHDWLALTIDVTALARAFPDTTIILDHFGGPVGVGSYAGRAREILAECFSWRERPRPPSSQELAVYRLTG